MTSRDVFSDSAPTSWTRDYAAIGARPTGSGDEVLEMEDDATLAFAFRSAGDILADHWRAGTDDSLVLVILYSYRHALELGLKAILRAMVNSAEFEQMPGTELPGIFSTVAKRLPLSHKLSELADFLVKLAPMFTLDLQDDIEQVCDLVHSVDPDGQTFRYTEVKVGKGMTAPARPQALYVNVPEFTRRAGEAGDGLDTLLGQITDVQDLQTSRGPDYLWDAAAAVRDDN
ncbi:hypothetical protein ACWD6R_39315 [Streptomyces sp. NPDC005151]